MRHILDKVIEACEIHFDDNVSNVLTRDLLKGNKYVVGR